MLVTLSQIAIGTTDLVAAFLFLFGLKRMSSPATAASGIRLAGIGMVAAVLVSFLYVFSIDDAARPHLIVNLLLALVALAIGGGGAWLVGRKVAMTAMPQMVAIYTGMGGGAAGGIVAVELFGDRAQGGTALIVTLLGALIGAVSMSGSVIAWAKLQGVLGTPLRFTGQRVLNATVFAATLLVGGWLAFTALSGTPSVLPVETWILIFFGLALLFGILMTLPIGGADKAEQVYVIKRGQGKGYSGIVDALFYEPNADMVFGDAQAVLIKMIDAARGLGAAAA